VRVALGAASGEILWLILRQGLSMGVSSVALGIAGAMAIRRFLASFLFQVSSADAVTLGACSAILLTVVAAASLIPAMRATRIDPVQALRAE
jgi:putative ABC transport system permease protein